MREHPVSGNALHDNDEHGALPWLAPATLDPAQRRTYEAIVGGPRNDERRSMPLADAHGRLHGPFNAMLFSPAVGLAVQSLGGALRYEGVLPSRLRELVILEVARIRHCSYEWIAHESLARAAGLSDAEVTAIQFGDDGLSPTEQLVRTLTRRLLVTRNLMDDQIEAASTAIGVDGVCELIVLIAYYDLLAQSLQVWRTPLPPGVDPIDFG